MGNSLANQDKLRQQTYSKSIHCGLKNFIENECPIFLESLKSNDLKLKDIVVRQFNKHFSDRIFDNIYQIIPFLEELRVKRIKKLDFLTKEFFNQRIENLFSIKFSCLPCKINDCFALIYFDTGCSISCITFKNASKLGLVKLINENVKGVAIGFGCNRQIIGSLSCVPVQIGRNLIFNIDFVVINHASADFILIGADFMHKQKVKLDYLNETFIFPEQVIKEHILKFMPTKSKDQELYYDFFKYNLLKSARNQFELLKFDSIFLNNKKQNVQNSNLYVRVMINGHEILALIDSGADTSKISDNLAYKLNISSYIDYKKCKIAHGLGSVLSIGHIPPIPVEFDKKTILFVPFEVLNENNVNILLFGCDFFTYYGCKLDFGEKSIHISFKANCSYTLEEKTPHEMSFNNNLNESSDLIEPHIELEHICVNLNNQLYQLKKDYSSKRVSKQKTYHVEDSGSSNAFCTNLQISGLKETKKRTQSNQENQFHSNYLLPESKDSVITIEFN